MHVSQSFSRPANMMNWASCSTSIWCNKLCPLFSRPVSMMNRASANTSIWFNTVVCQTNNCDELDFIVNATTDVISCFSRSPDQYLWWIEQQPGPASNVRQLFLSPGQQLWWTEHQAAGASDTDSGGWWGRMGEGQLICRHVCVPVHLSVYLVIFNKVKESSLEWCL